MQLHTFKARSLSDALRIVREELGPDASVLHTREIGSPLGRFLCGRMIEVTASPQPCAPSRLPEGSATQIPPSRSLVAGAELQSFRRKFRQDLLSNNQTGASLIEQLAQRRRCGVSAPST